MGSMSSPNCSRSNAEWIIRRVAHTASIAYFCAFALRYQSRDWLGDQDVIASAAAAIQPGSPLQIANCSEVGAGICHIGKRGAIQHQ